MSDIAPQEYIDYIIMTKLWRCPPSVYLEQSEDDIALAVTIYNTEQKHKQKEERRGQQRARNK